MSLDQLIVAPLLTWVQVFIIGAAPLILEAVAVLIAGWVRHLSWPLHLGVLIPLAMSVCASILALHIHDAYLYWLPRDQMIQDGEASKAEVGYVMSGIAGAIHETTVLDWLIIGITSIMLVLGLAGLVRLIIRPRHRGNSQHHWQSNPSSASYHPD